MVVNIAKDEGKVTSMVSDYCPMTHEKNMLGNVRGKITRGERDEEDITLNENNKRKLEQAAARNKKEKENKEKETIKLERNYDNTREKGKRNVRVRTCKQKIYIQKPTHMFV